MFIVTIVRLFHLPDQINLYTEMIVHIKGFQSYKFVFLKRSYPLLFERMCPCKRLRCFVAPRLSSYPSKG